MKQSICSVLAVVITFIVIVFLSCYASPSSYQFLITLCDDSESFSSCCDGDMKMDQRYNKTFIQSIACPSTSFSKMYQQGYPQRQPPSSLSLSSSVPSTSDYDFNKTDEIVVVDEDDIKDENDNNITLMLHNLLPSDRRYLVFHLFEGFNNQRMMIYRAMLFCKLLNRTCIIPPIYKHTTGGYKVTYQLSKGSYAVAEKIFDMEAINNFTAAISLPVTVRNFEYYMQSPFPINVTGMPRNILKQSNEWFIHFQNRGYVANHQINLIDFVNLYQDINQKFLYLAGHILWQPFNNAEKLRGKSVFAEAMKHLRMHDKIQYFAFNLIKHTPVLNIGKRFNYNALHVRQGDAKDIYKGTVYTQPTRYFASEASKRGFSATTSIVYVSTEAATRESNIFHPLEQNYTLVFVNDLNSTWLSYLDDFIKKSYFDDLRNDIIGMIEQIICANAIDFIGSNGSTFTEMIIKMRIKQFKPFLLNLDYAE